MAPVNDGPGRAGYAGKAAFVSACASLLVLSPLVAQADELDTLQLRVGQSFQHDSNVFRLSDSANPQAVLGRPERSDTIGVTTAGIKLDKPYSLQRIELDVYVERFRYKNYSSLDFTALNYAAAWRWSLTPALHGNLTADRRQYVDNSADTQNLGRVNRRTDRSTLADAEYELGSAWRLLGGVFSRSTRNSQSATSESDYTITGGQAGARYEFASGNSLAYRFKSGDGEYPDRTLSSFFARDFREREHEFRAIWAPMGKTSVQARLSHLERKHDGLAARDFSGLTGQVDATLNATAKTTLTAGYIRELENYQTATASYYQGHRFFIAPAYKPTIKTAVRLRYDHGRRNFRGALPGVVATDRKDTLNLTSLTLEYQPFRALTLIGWVLRDKRDSTEVGADYKSNVFGISAVANF
jgi:exopolysaccharide biosynthesis operon protein EpsL